MPNHHHVVPPYHVGPGLQHGIASDCPFCKARQDTWPAVGKSIRFLSGSQVGQVGLVVENSEVSRSIGRFLVKLPYGDEHTRTMVDPILDLFVDQDLMTVPTWMPPLSIEDACALHEQVLESLRWPARGRSGKAAAKIVQGVITRCWGDRLPLTGQQVWAVLAAHGAKPSLKLPSIELFDFGMAVLVGSQGRAPVKRRLMAPLSRGRYLSKQGREMWLKLFRHD